MFNVGAGELMVILVLALVVIGPEKLPEAARKIGKFMTEVRRMSDGFQTEIRQAIKADELIDSYKSVTNTISSVGRDVIAGGQGPSLPPLESEVRAANTETAAAPTATAAIAPTPVAAPTTTAAPAPAATPPAADESSAA